MNLEKFEESAIDRCHRVKSVQPGASQRPILTKLTSYPHKRNVIQARRKLTATGIEIKEDLTQANNKLFNQIFKHGKVINCFTLGGRIKA